MSAEPMDVLRFVAGLGVLGSLITIAVDVIAGWRRRRRERRGLLMLLARDIEMYERQWEVFEDEPTWVTRSPDYLWSMKVWEDNRARFSQLLKAEPFADMVRLFQTMTVLKENRELPAYGPEFAPGVAAGDYVAFGESIAQAAVPQLKRQTATVKSHINKYVSEDALRGSLGGGVRPLPKTEKPADSP